jgi:hypothetical protein
MRVLGTFTGVLIIVAAIHSCIPIPGMGGNGEPCSSNGACLGNLECCDGTCMQSV